jgi:hypothetical protein
LGDVFELKLLGIDSQPDLGESAEDPQAGTKQVAVIDDCARAGSAVVTV